MQACIGDYEYSHLSIVKPHACTVKTDNRRVVTIVAWLHGFSVVVEANQPVSLLFPHSGIRKRGGNKKETTSGY